MTPKEKAKELVDKFSKEILSISSNSNWKPEAKKCALICVEQLIEDYEHETHDSDRWQYWIRVKQEIEKL